MVYNTEDTDWPAFEIGVASKDLISRFFLLLDTESGDVGARLADDIFMPNARAEFGGKLFSGEEGNRFICAQIPIHQKTHGSSQRYACQETMRGKRLAEGGTRLSRCFRPT